MKKFLKNQKGINLISLSIAVMILLVLTGMIIYNVKDNLKLEKLRSMQADIENLRDKVSSYYAQYGEIPANKSIEYTNTQNIKNAGLISEAVDTGKFYVIDLSSMENITLNYGEDYQKIKSGEATTSEEINALTDLYIINDASHNIFFVDGIEIDGETFYTDYTKEDVDTKSADLEYVDGVKIPDGFYYVGGTKDTGLVISDVEGDDLENSKQGNQFVWIPVESKEDYQRDFSYPSYYDNESDHTPEGSTFTDTGYLPEGIQPEVDTAESNEAAEREAVVNAGGFYIARFEAGKEGTDTLVSKKNMPLWTDVTQQDAKSISKTMYNNDSVKSALCSGIQWDMVMHFVDQKNDGMGKIFDVRVHDSTRHIGSKVETGENNNDKVQNIYDLEGNCYEWVAEKNNSHLPLVGRGGNYDSNNDKASKRGGGDGARNHTTFRAVLYVIDTEKWSATYDKTATYTDKNGDTATIPAGFQVSENQGEDEVKEGLVVKGSDGSEFVWVPVEDINTMAQCETAGGDCNLQLVDGVLKCTNEAHSSTAEKIVGKLWATTDGESFGTENTVYTPNSGLREPDIVTDYDNNTSYNNGLFTLGSLKEEYNEMATSVAKNKGFYIGRYETSLSTATDKDVGTSGTACSKAGVLPTAANNQATNRWYGLYSISKTYTVSDNSVQSSMIWGSQYDAMLNWVKNSNSPDKDKMTTPGIGNNSGEKLATTGNDNYSNDNINNIRDLGGNLLEWTLEANISYVRIGRGSYYNYSAGAIIVRTGGNPTYESKEWGSRLTLYIK